jgi:prolyl oligopeptidase
VRPFSFALFTSDLKKCRITNHGPLLYVQTNLDAPQHKVVTVDLSKEEIEIRDFIPEVKDAKLVQVNCVNKEYFVVIYKRDVIPISF